MASINALKQEIEEVKNLQYISQAFTETSAAKIRGIKDTFEKNKAFYEEISHLFDLVEYNAEKAKAEQPQKKIETPKEIRSLSVALTSNQRFYGSINVNIMQQFVKDTQTSTADLLVIGATGKDFMKSAHHDKQYTSHQFEKDIPTKEEIRVVLEKFKPYQSVFLYYPKFVTILSQTVGKIDITHRESAPDFEKTAAEEIHIIFEPEIQNMIEFFEEQVKSTLFLRVILETDLARTAARLLSMTSAEDNAKTMLKEKMVEMRKLYGSLMNREQMEKFSGMSVWKKGRS